MRPYVQLAVALSVTVGVSVAAILQWRDPEPAVYEAALQSFYSYSAAVASSPSSCGIESPEFTGISPPLIAAFQNANAPGSPLGNVSGLRNHFAIANSSALASLESAGHTKQTVGASQSPVLRLSRVGFSPDGSEALVCIRAPYGSVLVHLRYTSGSWQVASQEPIQVT